MVAVVAVVVRVPAPAVGVCRLLALPTCLSALVRRRLQVGCGAAGLLDGDFASAAFHRPQGLAYSAKVRRGRQGARREAGGGCGQRALLTLGSAEHESAPSLLRPPTHLSAAAPQPCTASQRNCLYVADTEAHALREVDLSARSVRTLAGTGRKGADYSGGAAGAAQALNSPWDVALDRWVGRLGGARVAAAAAVGC